MSIFKREIDGVGSFFRIFAGVLADLELSWMFFIDASTDAPSRAGQGSARSGALKADGIEELALRLAQYGLDASRC